MARNYVQFFVDGGCAPREDVEGGRFFASEPTPGRWRSGNKDHQAVMKRLDGAAHGVNRGFFEWNFPFTAAELRCRSRITLLCEASAFRQGTPQTDSFAQPTTLRMLLNGVPVYQTVLPNHPHDARRRAQLSER